MLFFQQSATVDKGLTRKDIHLGRIDTVVGAALAAAAAVATIIATAPLFAHHMTAENFQGAEFAQALQPLIGRFGAALFALGIVEAGMVASVTISISSAYAFGEVVHRPHSLNLPVTQGKSFYSVLFLLRGNRRSNRLNPRASTGLCGSAGQRGRGAGDAARAGVPVHACERPRSHGRSCESDVGEHARYLRRRFSDACGPALRHQRDCAECLRVSRREVGGPKHDPERERTRVRSPPPIKKWFCPRSSRNNSRG